MSLKIFVEKIQKSDRATRKLWLAALVSLSMVIIVSGWGFYLNAMVVSAELPVGSLAEEKQGLFSAVSDRTISGLANSYVYFRQKIRTKNQFSVNRGGHNFIYDELETLPVRELP